ncbi:hypothetical protein LKO27_09755 [Tessaracoccus sp. OS52]|uniref:putative acetyltransferase n=1 Tax=Tessaracoccus sp. OS52 TaxID=2886691 RepID=UPI001D119B93|nr:hypothetical protein [Tessaracoccus sp. OS52]MCC2593687.1 hypothetical protein [Tessaracoccus sp. OS52]
MPGLPRGFREVPIGQRVTVRFLLDDGSATDAVGPVTERDEETFVVATKRRGEVRIRYDRVVAARVIAP